MATIIRGTPICVVSSFEEVAEALQSHTVVIYDTSKQKPGTMASLLWMRTSHRPVCFIYLTDSEQSDALASIVESHQIQLMHGAHCFWVQENVIEVVHELQRMFPSLCRQETISDTAYL